MSGDEHHPNCLGCGKPKRFDPNYGLGEFVHVANGKVQCPPAVVLVEAKPKPKVA